MLMAVYIIIATVLLFAAELAYFRIADRCGIKDVPNARSSHNTVVLRGGGIIFLVAGWIWSACFGFAYPWFLAGLTLVSAVSFADDVRPQPNAVRLVAQFAAAAMAFWQLGLLRWEIWWVAPLALTVYVGVTNVVNFMDGINGITAANALAVLVPFAVVNAGSVYVEQSLVLTAALAALVFGFFNLRPKGRAKCFAGDVGSVGVAFVLLFLLGSVIVRTGDVTWLIFLLVYGVDGCLTMAHRVWLGENLGLPHRKHAYQLMANELGIGHVKISLLYMTLQLAVSLGFVCLCPDSPLWHWAYLAGAAVLLAAAYVLFMGKYYHLHEEYLASLGK